MSDGLRSFLGLELNFQDSESEAKFFLGVPNSKLGASISEATKIPCKSNEFVLELLRGVRLHFDKLIKIFKPGGSGLAHSSKVDLNDNMVIQTISSLDTLDRDINSFSKRVRECYGAHFPELVKIINDKNLYVKVSHFIGNKSELREDKLPALTEIVGDEDKAKEIIKAAKVSMGQDLCPLDLITVQTCAQTVTRLSESRTKLYDNLVTKMNEIAPNLSSLIGEMVGARLISHAGSLANLAKCPSSTLQILGAEKALSRALKTRGSTPKHGLIFHSSFIASASSPNKGRMARYLASKCSIASRIDCFSEKGSTVFGKNLREQVEERLDFYEKGVAPRKKIHIEVPHEETEYEVGPILELPERSLVRKTEYEVGQILELAERSSVRISAAYENTGSGIILLKVGEDCLILTCGHVVEPAIQDGCEIEVMFSNGYSSLAFKLVSLPEQCCNEFALLFGHDERLLKLDVDNICTFSELEEPFEELFCSSYAYGGVDPIVVGGRVSQYTLKNTDEDRGLIAYDLAMAKSSSGAGILNRRGEIVAVHVKGVEAVVLDEDGEKVGGAAGVVKKGLYSRYIIDELRALCQKLRVDTHPTASAMLTNLFMHISKKEKRARDEEKSRVEERKAKKRQREEEREARKRKGEVKRKKA